MLQAKCSEERVGVGAEPLPIPKMRVFNAKGIHTIRKKTTYLTVATRAGLGAKWNWVYISSLQLTGFVALCKLLIALYLYVLICQMGIVIVPSLQDIVSNKRD